MTGSARAAHADRLHYADGVDATPSHAGHDQAALVERRDWLIYDRRSECYWGPNRGGYFKSIADAGLYTEKAAREAEDFAKRYQRHEVARPLWAYREAIERLHAALSATPGGVR